MELRLEREPTVEGATFGTLYINGRIYCRTLEDEIRPSGTKLASRTAIPAGRYKVIINHSLRFRQDLPLLLEVPGFTGIRIHPGNTTADTDGCILLGMSRTGLTVNQSRKACTLVQDEITRGLAKGESVWITIVNPPSPETSHAPSV